MDIVPSEMHSLSWLLSMRCRRNRSSLYYHTQHPWSICNISLPSGHTLLSYQGTKENIKPLWSQQCAIKNMEAYLEIKFYIPHCENQNGPRQVENSHYFPEVMCCMEIQLGEMWRYEDSMPKEVKNFEAPQEQGYNGAYDVWEFKIRPFLLFFSWQVLQSGKWSGNAKNGLALKSKIISNSLKNFKKH